MRLFRVCLITMVALTAVMVACENEPPSIPEDIEWEVVKTKKFTKLGIPQINMRVNLNKRVDESALRAIADKLRKEAGARSKDDVAVWFYLPGMNLGRGAWGTVLYDHRRVGEVEIIIMSPELEKIERELGN